MTFDLFVLPFFLGLIFLLVVLFIKYSRWIALIDRSGRRKIGYGLISLQLFPATWEVISEGLFHRRMFKQDKLLGYMHMSFALGWFLLILMGNFESRIYSRAHINPPYYPIFLKFFVHDTRVLPFELNTIPGFFRFIMDFLLLYILSGLALAFFKRARSKWFGMKHTTKHTLLDRFALTSLWFIFPLRLLAESFTAAIYGGGGFLTNSLGDTIAGIVPAQSLYPVSYAFWWAYSTALGTFFVTLPWSRYMHIPTEIVLIYLRHFGVKTGKKLDSFSELEMRACSRCGVCIDVCQMNAAGCTPSTSVYFLRNLRSDQSDAQVNANCMLCGRCAEACPVNINLMSLRSASRYPDNILIDKALDYLPVQKKEHKHINVLYFAGCMGHLTPAVKKAMLRLMDEANVKYSFMDRDGSICCGRPLMMAGMYEAARSVIENNRQLIMKSGARILVTSCPICYKVFNEEYRLPGIEILHHTQYLLRLAQAGSLWLNKSELNVVYHDPCELGRGSGIYKEPRKLLNRFVKVTDIEDEREHSLCCGGSIGDTVLDRAQRKTITDEALKILTAPKPDVLVTACPLCKKTFDAGNDLKVMDIAELVEAHLDAD